MIRLILIYCFVLPALLLSCSGKGIANQSEAGRLTGWKTKGLAGKVESVVCSDGSAVMFDRNGNIWKEMRGKQVSFYIYETPLQYRTSAWDKYKIVLNDTARIIASDVEGEDILPSYVFDSRGRFTSVSWRNYSNGGSETYIYADNGLLPSQIIKRYFGDDWGESEVTSTYRYTEIDPQGNWLKCTVKERVVAENLNWETEEYEKTDETKTLQLTRKITYYTDGQVAPIPQQNYAVSSSTLNVRSGPGVDYQTAGSLKKGDKVYVGGFAGEWAWIDWQGKAGFVNVQYLQPDGDVKTAKTVASPANTSSLAYAAFKFMQPLPYATEKILLIVMILLCILHASCRYIFDILPESKQIVAAAVMLVLTVAVEIYFFFVSGIDRFWFLEDDAIHWLWCLLNLILFFGFIFYQLLLMYEVFIPLLEYTMDRTPSRAAGIMLMLSVSIPVLCIFAERQSFWFFGKNPEIARYSLILPVAYVLFHIIYMLFSSSKTNPVRTLLSGIATVLFAFYVAAGLAVAAGYAIVHLVMIVIYICILVCILKAIFSSGSSSSSHHEERYYDRVGNEMVRDRDGAYRDTNKRGDRWSRKYGSRGEYTSDPTNIEVDTSYDSDQFNPDR